MNHPFHPVTEKKPGDAVMIYLSPSRSERPFRGVISRVEKDEAIVTWEAVRPDVPRRLKLLSLIKL
jgi:hypothetical protein